MSGPKTSHYTILAAQRQREQQRQAREAFAARVNAAKRQCAELETKHFLLSSALSKLRQKFQTQKINVELPAFIMPETDDPTRLEDTATKYQRLLAQVEIDLKVASAQAQANVEFRDALQSTASMSPAEGESATEAITRFLEKLADDQVNSIFQDRKKSIDRLLGHFGLSGFSSCPPKLYELIMSALQAPSATRFDGLLDEIRLQMSRQEAAELAAKLAADQATELLDLLESALEDDVQGIKQDLELVRVGATPMTPEIESKAREILSNAKDLNQTKNNEAASLILSNTLSDLGYEVASIEDTLFVKGGKVYFRKPGWNNYCVRLTVRPEESKMNFNVVRMLGERGETETASRTSDIEAENAWCSGYDALIDSLATRGLEAKLTRHLPVGAVPVPGIDKNEISIENFSNNSTKKKTKQQQVTKIPRT